MKKKKITVGKEVIEIAKDVLDGDFFEHSWEESWTYIKTVVDVVREPMLILDKRFCVIAANEPFYETFMVKREETEDRIVYQLGNGQWDIPTLRKLLEDILPKDTFFKGFEVDHVFPVVGRKIMILNARQLHFKEHDGSKIISPIILLAMEDVTQIMGVAEMLARHTSQFEGSLSERTERLEQTIVSLEKQINALKKSSKK